MTQRVILEYCKALFCPIAIRQMYLPTGLESGAFNILVFVMSCRICLQLHTRLSKIVDERAVAEKCKLRGTFEALMT